MTQKNILVAALDWGLGHATRLMPVINLLKAKECNVILASSGSALVYWQKEFPTDNIIELPAYNPVYSGNMNFSMILQTPKFLNAIYAENMVLKEIVKQYNIHGIISDNRYGFYHTEIPSVLITHQLFIQTPKGLSFLKPILKKINFQFIKQYRYCWIPDIEGSDNLSGGLSHGEDLPHHCRYIGLLSRFEHEELPIEHDVLLLLSGPEPQRSILEEKLLTQLKNTNQRIVLVRGTNQQLAPQNKFSETMKIIDIASTAQLLQLLNQSAIVVARAGYSSIMDLVVTQKPAVLIPTTAQTEQEYLAHYLQQKNWFVSAAQNNFSLKDLLPKAMQLQTCSVKKQTNLLNKVIDEFLDSIN